MTNVELDAEVTRREAEGRTHMILTVRRKSEPKGRRVRVLPGVFGVMVGFEGGTVIVDVKVADLRRYLDRAPRCLFVHFGEGTIESRTCGQIASHTAIREEFAVPATCCPLHAAAIDRAMLETGRERVMGLTGI